MPHFTFQIALIAFILISYIEYVRSAPTSQVIATNFFKSFKHQNFDGTDLAQWPEFFTKFTNSMSLATEFVFQEPWDGSFIHPSDYADVAKALQICLSQSLTGSAFQFYSMVGTPFQNLGS